MKKALSILTMSAALALTAAEEIRIAVVDADRVFKEYYKSRIAEDFLNGQREAIRLYMSQQTAQLETLRAEAGKLSTNAQNPALSAGERAKAAEAAAEAAGKVTAKERELARYAAERSRDFQRMAEEKRNEIVQEIQTMIRRRAAAGNYTFVLDCSGKSANNLPVVLVYPKRNDISDAVIRELNRPASKPNTEQK